VDPDHLVLRPRKMRSGQRFSYLALEPEETRALERRLPPAHPPRPIQSHPVPKAFIQTALELLASDRYLQKGMGLMALTGRRPAEIFFSASFSLPREKLPYPALLFDGQLENLAKLPAPAPSPTSSPSWPSQRNLSRPSILSGTSKASLPPQPSTPSTGPRLPKYVSAAFGSLDLPWKPGHLRSAYGAICCHKFKPKNQTDDIFLVQIPGHKLLGPNASLSVGQSYKDFYIRKPSIGTVKIEGLSTTYDSGRSL
jgi:hypothetical protein